MSHHFSCQRLSIALLLLVLSAVSFAQHGRFTDEMPAPGGAPLDPVTLGICVIANVMIVTALLRGSDEQNRRAAAKGGCGAGIGLLVGILIGLPVAVLFLFGTIAFFVGYGQDKQPPQ